MNPSDDPPILAGGQEAPVLRNPFWDYKDLFLFASLLIPSLLIALILMLVVGMVTTLSLPFRLLLAQLLWYGFAFGALYALLRLRYGQPFWRSLGWKPVPFFATAVSFVAGPMLALAIGYLGSALHTPEIQLPFQRMLADRSTTVLLGILVVGLGPLCEELAFRGFLMPLLVRSLGPAAGILLTGVIFGSMHGYEYNWSWRHMLLISAAGSAFGLARYETGSTAPAVFMHATFNLTQFAAFLAQSRTL
jgi:membrane protease YdiL (CAAX protease family)